MSMVFKFTHYFFFFGKSQKTRRMNTVKSCEMYVTPVKKYSYTEINILFIYHQLIYDTFKKFYINTQILDRFE